MINKILGKFGYIKEENLKEIMRERDFYAKAFGHEATERNVTLEAFENKRKQIRELEKEIDNLREREAELKSRLADEIQKRYQLATLFKYEKSEVEKNV